MTIARRCKSVRSLNRGMRSRYVKTALGFLVAVALVFVLFSTYFCVFKIQFPGSVGKPGGSSLVIAFRLIPKERLNTGDRIAYRVRLAGAAHPMIGTIVHIRRQEDKSGQVVRDSVEQKIADRIMQMDEPEDAFLVSGESPVQTQWITAQNILGKVLKTVPQIPTDKAP